MFAVDIIMRVGVTMDTHTHTHTQRERERERLPNNNIILTDKFYKYLIHLAINPRLDLNIATSSGEWSSISTSGYSFKDSTHTYYKTVTHTHTHTNTHTHGERSLFFIIRLI